MTIHKGQVFYVDETKWNNEVVTREGGSFLIHRAGTLTVLGFSDEPPCANNL